MNLHILIPIHTHILKYIIIKCTYAYTYTHTNTKTCTYTILTAKILMAGISRILVNRVWTWWFSCMPCTRGVQSRFVTCNDEKS